MVRLLHNGERMNAKDYEVIQLLCHFDPSDNKVFLGHLSRSPKQLFVLVLAGGNERCKAKERSGIVLLTDPRSRWNDIDEPVVSSDLQNVSEGGHQHVAC